MSENTDNTLSSYLGPDFQQRLLWQLLVEHEFAEKIIKDLAIEYFDDPNIKRLFIIMLQYFKEYGKVPNLQSRSVHQAISEFKTPNNVIEEESLGGVINRIELWNERVINKQMHFDGDVVQKAAYQFIKQQEYRKIAEDIQSKVKNGNIKSKHTVNEIEEKFLIVSEIGEVEDDSEELIENISSALRKEFRQTIPTGVAVIDSLTGGGLGKGEIGLILTPSGVGKTTLLTVIANTAYELEKNVAQVIFEDTKEQVKRKHFTIWAKSSLSRLNEDDENERVNKIVTEKAKAMAGKGRVMIKRFSQENTTMKDIRNWMEGQEKKFGFKFDILVLDYLDCLESGKRSVDRNESELAIIKAFEATAAELDIPCWSAVQSNRSGFGSEFVEAHQSGGSIKRIQKAHFFMSVAKTPAQQEANLANIRIIKARFAKDGHTFEDCVFNNNTMEIIINDPRYPITKNLKHHDTTDINSLEDKASSLAKIHSKLSHHDEENIVGRANDDNINDGRSESQKFNDLLHQNNVKEEQPKAEIQGDVEALLDNSREVYDPEHEGHLKEVMERSISEQAPESTDNIEDLMGDILNIDTDAPVGADKEVNDILVQKRDYQNVKKNV